jgi:hypothetical protein
MADNLGPGVSRVLDPTATQYVLTLWQQGKPPLDSELNLLQQLATQWNQAVVMRAVPSGWLGAETNNAADFITNPTWSNWWRFGRQRTGEQQAVMWAVVNGWVIPVTGTRTGSPPGSPDNADTWNKIAMDPPPSNAGDFRIDFVFLEAWLARVPPNPSTLNKPASSAIWRYGNVEGGYSFLPDDIQDPAIGAETTERVQLQYRIRVQKGLVGFTSAPDGFDPAVVFAQGASSAPTTYNFLNMRQALGDPGLWRAGDGSGTAQTALGTVDGYSYAIPIAAVFRRNSVSWLGDPSPNLNGGFNRNITAIDRTGIQTYSTVPTISAPMTATSGSVTLTSVANIPLPISPSVPVLIQIGDELMTYTGISGLTMTGITRGVFSSRAEAHATGSVITVLSGRPDGLFADQIADNDLLDLRHVVNPNGFDYDALLRFNFDRLIRGNLHSNWKRTGAGPQGPFVLYQDKIINTGGGVALGVTRLDGPDDIREVFSDAASPQSVLFIATPSGTGPIPPSPATNVTSSWDLELTINQTIQSVNNQFNPGDQLTIPIAQFKTGFPAGDSDQIRFINDGLSGAVVIRVDGQSDPVPASAYTVTPASPGPSDNLVITLGGTFPVGTTGQLFITTNVQYGPGRGVARRPDSFHSVAFENPANPGLLYRPTGVPQQYNPMHVGWAALRSNYRNTVYKGLLPVTAESYADPGSKTLILSPFRRISLPLVQTHDGTAANINVGVITTYTTGSTNGTTTLRDATASPFLPSQIGSAIVVTTGPQPGRYTFVTNALSGNVGVTNLSPTVTTTVSQVGVVQNGDIVQFVSQPNIPYTVLSVAPGAITLTTNYTGGTNPSTTAYDQSFAVLDRLIPTASGLNYSVQAAQGLMPVRDRNGNAKWGQTDPLNLFSSGNITAYNPAAQANIYVQLPRDLVPAWGEYHVPILPNDQGDFSEGVNFMSLSVKGAPPRTDTDKNFVPYVSANGGGITFQTFSTSTLSPVAPAPYNQAFSYGGLTIAGMQRFTDNRGMGRQGLQLPPFYGIARLFAVYEATDYAAHGSAYDPNTRNPVAGKATNLLRQNVQGPTFWVEIDADGDSTFILNAACIDISRSPTPISAFSAADYVIEASIFGFDRGFFDLTQEARLVMTASSPPVGGGSTTRSQAASGTRASNIGVSVSGPTTVLPGPLSNADAVVINYSRTPYMGDAWGSQTNYIDIAYTPGPLLTGNAYQIVSTTLDQAALTRPNQKLLEVLSSIGFVTTLGTGRPVGDYSVPPSWASNDIGYEDPTQYPPTSALQARPTTLAGNFVGDTSSIEIGSDILGLTERLPLGALFRDKDFRGESFGNPLSGPFVLTDDVQGGLLGSLALPPPGGRPPLEAPVQSVDLAIGQPGDLLVHVDGNQGNYTLLTNYRVNRGGSVFNASGPRPGGEVASIVSPVKSITGHTNVVCGRAFLVRNTVTNLGSTEVSGGDELMMLIVTSVQRLTDTNAHLGQCIIGTNGSYEGYSAADLYRIEGHPLMNDNVRNDLDPNAIPLSPRAF